MCLQNVLKTFEWSVNKLAQSQNGPELVTNAWHVWSHTFITHVNSIRTTRLGLFQGSDFAGDPEDSKSTSRDSCAYSYVFQGTSSVHSRQSRKITTISKNDTHVFEQNKMLRASKKTNRQQYREQKTFLTSEMASTLEVWTSCDVITAAVQVQCVHKLRVCTARRRQQHF